MSKRKIYQVKQIKHYGFIKHCLALKIPDIGKATLADGKKVFISWGLNLEVDEADYYCNNLGYDCVQRKSPDNDKFEVILPNIENEFPIIKRKKL